MIYCCYFGNKVDELFFSEPDSDTGQVPEHSYSKQLEVNAIFNPPTPTPTLFTIEGYYRAYLVFPFLRKHG